MQRLLLAVCLLGTLAHAETYVIAAGVEKYDDERISSLKYACADARSVAAVIRASGVPARNVFILSSDSPLATAKPTRIALLGVLERVRERAAAGDKVVFFFAGHGVEEGGEQFLLTVDTRRSLLSDTALPMRLVSKALTGVQASAVVLLIDACRNDPNAGRSDADSVLTDGLARGVRPLLQPAAGAKPALVATLLACDVGQRAYEDPERGHGAFTVALLRGLSGEAKAADGLVHLTGLAEFVRREVGLWSERSQHQQTPKLVNPDGGDVELLQPPAEPLVSVTIQNQPLSALVALLGEQYGAQIVLGKGVDPDSKVTGRLENQPLSAALQVLLVAYDLAVRRKGTVYIIEAEGTTPEPEPPTPARAELPPNWPAYLAKWRDQMPAGLQYRVREKDGMPQVLIPAGEFLMGSPEGQGYPPEHPQRRVYVSAFWMDLHHVTVAQYKRFCGATGNQMPEQPDGNGEDHPVVNVNWFDAAVYCDWVGGRLPTEAQWEKAARSGMTTAYYWGDQWDPSRAAGANEFGKSTAVGSYAPNGFGLFDMCGNVWHWCQDVYDSSWYARMPSRDPYNYAAQGGRSLRGGSADRGVSHPTVTVRSSGSGFGDAVYGFRASAPTEPGPQGAELPPNWPAHLASWRDHMPAGLQYRVREKDGMPQVLIPEGEFAMGASPEQIESAFEQAKANNVEAKRERFAAAGPQKRVHVSAFWMDVHEVTVGQYQRYCQATGKPMPSGNDKNESLPVVNVDWNDAEAYAKWAGGSLPTEAQWERAARGGLERMAYAWGDEWDPSKANYGSGTMSVGTRAPNSYGLFGMAGNVWEWCLDYNDPDGDWYARMPSRDPVNRNRIYSRVYRGGSYACGPCDLQVARRTFGGPLDHSPSLGFRCAEAARVEGSAQVRLAAGPAVAADIAPKWPAYVAKWLPQMPAGLQYRVREVDGMPQVLIPAGDFLMGDPDPEAHYGYPQKRVSVSALWMDQHEVTVAQYKRFCAATGKLLASGNSDDTHPVVNVYWEDADDYAKWAGGSLPTEAQWEKAARGGLEGMVWPWGNDWDEAKANFNQKGTTPVCAYPPNGYGLFDMAGNVVEWCLDYYDEGWYVKAPTRNPAIAEAELRVMKGGSYGNPHDMPLVARTQDTVNGHYPVIGFRCVQSP